jgi:hypothetical protein
MPEKLEEIVSPVTYIVSSDFYVSEKQPKSISMNLTANLERAEKDSQQDSTVVDITLEVKIEIKDANNDSIAASAASKARAAVYADEVHGFREMMVEAASAAYSLARYNDVLAFSMSPVGMVQTPNIPIEELVDEYLRKQADSE